MKVFPEGISQDMLVKWVDRTPADNPQLWKLKDGAPEIMQVNFERIKQYFTPSDPNSKQSM